MNIVLQSVATGALVVLAVCAIVVPTILIAQFHGFKKDFKKTFHLEDSDETQQS